jgi:hypothetical protein
MPQAYMKNSAANGSAPDRWMTHNDDPLLCRRGADPALAGL